MAGTTLADVVTFFAFPDLATHAAFEHPPPTAMTTDPDFDPTTEPPSKSARKREHHELQQLAATLLALRATELARIPLDPALATALEATRSITQREARRRQLQYLGKLMRNADHQQIRAALAGLQLRQSQFRQHLERTDRLCADLIAGGDHAIEALIDATDQPPETAAEAPQPLTRHSGPPTGRQWLVASAFPTWIHSASRRSPR